jgi:hypothetical protein
MFRQEFMAAFDAMAGVALQGDWLRYYVTATRTCRPTTSACRG